MTARNDITGDALRSKGATNSYRDGWDRIFGKRPQLLNYIARRRPGNGLAVEEAIKLIDSFDDSKVLRESGKSLLISVTAERLEALQAAMPGWAFSEEHHYKLPDVRLSARLYDDPPEDHHD